VDEMSTYLSFIERWKEKEYKWPYIYHFLSVHNTLFLAQEENERKEENPDKILEQL
jgi:hypothetical protein